MKTKERRGLINELKELRKVVTGLEKVEAERRKIEKELRKSEREKALVLDNTGEIIAFINLPIVNLMGFQNRLGFVFLKTIFFGKINTTPANG